MMNLIEPIKDKQSPIIHASVDQLQFVPGIWIDGKYSWIQNSQEKVLYKEELVIKVKQEQIHSKIRYSSVYVSNHGHETKEIKILAMHHYPSVSGEQLTFVSPSENRIFHLVNNNIYMVNGQYQGLGLVECTTMPQWKVFTDQIWSSLKKGSLKYQPMAKGLASSIFTIKMTIKPRETTKMSTWVINGTNKNEVTSLEQVLLKNILAFPFEK
jgi:hypothetical protein